MKKKGFTLIELLAVIVILAILALILMPMIQELILNARKSTFERSIDGILAAAEYYQIENPNSESIAFTCDGTSCEDSNGNKLEFKGEVPISGTITISETGVVAENLCNQSFCGSGSRQGLAINIGGGDSNSSGPADNQCTTLLGYYGAATAGQSWDFDYHLSSSRVIENSNIAYQYGYTGKAEIFVVPFTGEYKIELWGAQGGSVAGAVGGKGGYVSGKITLNKGEKIYVYVGESVSTYADKINFNGGGRGSYSTSETSPNGNGGGATDIRLVGGSWDDFDSLKSRIMVAGGGGGSAQWTGHNLNGGAGGGLTGASGTSYRGGGSATLEVSKGGTQISGGLYAAASPSYDGSTKVGTFGSGGSSDTYSSTYIYYSGGGGGYYGGGTGGAASNYVGSAAGGSSYISGHEGCDAIDKTSTVDNIVHTGQSNHYSNRVFTDTIMIGGGSSMPTHDGTSTMTGNAGNGFAKITYLTPCDGEAPANTGIQSFLVPKTGTYKLEVWGAEGGSYNATYHGGYGGYSTGEIRLNKDDTLYIAVGGAGRHVGSNSTAIGGFNGGGGLSYWSDGNERRSTGGGATHIALNNNLGELKNYVDNKDDILIVAGGGGGGQANAVIINQGGAGYGGSGGGTTGGHGHGKQYSNVLEASGGGQNSAPSGAGFGYGGSTINGDGNATGAGGGWYGGQGLYRGAGGGSGHLSESLTNAHMACYSCMDTFDDVTINTIDTSLVAEADKAKLGNGYAKITYLGN